MIDLEKIEKWAKGIDDVWMTKEEANELLHLAKEGLRFKELREAENGVANLMAVIELGRWAKQEAIPFIIEISKEKDGPPGIFALNELINERANYTGNALRAQRALESIQRPIQKSI